MGGVQFRNLNDITKDIWRWCEKKKIWIFASYIASAENVEADFESRRKESTAEIELSSVAFTKITDRLGKPEIDLFASRVNAKCEKYISWKRDPGSIAIDAFTQNWNKHFFYAFPPCSIILKTLQKIREERAEGIVVVPEWPAQPWYPLFCEMLASDLVIIKAKNNVGFSNREPDQFWNKVTLVAGILSGEPSK